jgi:hypothetical protein
MQIQLVNRAESEKVFLTASNIEGAVLEPGKVVEWSNTTTASNQGYQVELVDSAISTTAGIGGNKVAGVVDSTINTAAVGRIQVFGPANVRASASYDLSNLVAAGSINATNQGHVTTVAGHSDHGINYVAALVGHTLKAGPNATNATVQITYCL